MVKQGCSANRHSPFNPFEEGCHVEEAFDDWCPEGRYAPDGSGSRTNGLSNYEELFADVPAWAEKGYIDYIVPQLYWRIGHPAADYDILIHWWNDMNYKGQLYIGQSISTFNEPDLDNPAVTQTARKMQLERELPNVDGNVWWPGWTLAEKRDFALADSLRLIYQKHPALIPAYTDLDAVAPAPVASVQAGNRGISWKPVATDDVLQQPHFYVVYRFGAGEAIDLSESRHIVKITRDTVYKPVGKRDGKYRYVVTVVDRCWNESEPSKAIKW